MDPRNPHSGQHPSGYSPYQHSQPTLLNNDMTRREEQARSSASAPDQQPQRTAGGLSQYAIPDLVVETQRWRGSLQHAARAQEWLPGSPSPQQRSMQARRPPTGRSSSTSTTASFPPEVVWGRGDVPPWSDPSQHMGRRNATAASSPTEEHTHETLADVYADCAVQPDSILGKRPPSDDADTAPSAKRPHVAREDSPAPPTAAVAAVAASQPEDRAAVEARLVHDIGTRLAQLIRDRGNPSAQTERNREGFDAAVQDLARGFRTAASAAEGEEWDDDIYGVTDDEASESSPSQFGDGSGPVPSVEAVAAPAVSPLTEASREDATSDRPAYLAMGTIAARDMLQTLSPAPPAGFHRVTGPSAEHIANRYASRYRHWDRIHSPAGNLYDDDDDIPFGHPHSRRLPHQRGFIVPAGAPPFFAPWGAPRQVPFGYEVEPPASPQHGPAQLGTRQSLFGCGRGPRHDLHYRPPQLGRTPADGLSSPPPASQSSDDGASEASSRTLANSVLGECAVEEEEEEEDSEDDESYCVDEDDDEGEDEDDATDDNLGDSGNDDNDKNDDDDDDEDNVDDIYGDEGYADEVAPQHDDKEDAPGETGPDAPGSSSSDAPKAADREESRTTTTTTTTTRSAATPPSNRGAEYKLQYASITPSPTRLAPAPASQPSRAPSPTAAPSPRTGRIGLDSLLNDDDDDDDDDTVDCHQSSASPLKLPKPGRTISSSSSSSSSR